MSDRPMKRLPISDESKQRVLDEMQDEFRHRVLHEPRQPSPEPRTAAGLLRRLVAVVDAGSILWHEPVPPDAIDAIHEAKEYLALLAEHEAGAVADSREGHPKGSTGLTASSEATAPSEPPRLAGKRPLTPDEIQLMGEAAAALPAELEWDWDAEEGLYAAWKQGYYEGREDDEWRTQAEIEKRAAEYKARRR